RAVDIGCRHGTRLERLAGSAQVEQWRGYRPAALCTSGGKSDSSKTCRTSITLPSAAGQRDAHSTASAFDFTWIIQYPPMTSFASAKGPSVILALPPENEARAPFEGG